MPPHTPPSKMSPHIAQDSEEIITQAWGRTKGIAKVSITAPKVPLSKDVVKALSWASMRDTKCCAVKRQAVTRPNRTPIHGKPAPGRATMIIPTSPKVAAIQREG